MLGSDRGRGAECACRLRRMAMRRPLLLTARWGLRRLAGALLVLLHARALGAGSGGGDAPSSGSSAGDGDAPAAPSSPAAAAWTVEQLRHPVLGLVEVSRPPLQVRARPARPSPLAAGQTRTVRALTRWQCSAPGPQGARGPARLPHLRSRLNTEQPPRTGLGPRRCCACDTEVGRGDPSVPLRRPLSAPARAVRAAPFSSLLE